MAPRRDTRNPVSTVPYTRALVVANPVAGRGRGRPGAEALARGLSERGIEVEMHFTAARGDARERVARLAPEVDLVVAVGGDGTVSEVLEGLSPREVPLAILPLGTANVLALDLGLPREPAGTLAMIGRNRIEAVDTACVNGSRLSFLLVGVGFDARVIEEFERRRRGPVTRLSYVGAGLRTLVGWQPVPLEVWLDGERHPRPCFQVVASNAIHYGGFDVLDHDRRIGDGRFEVYLFEKGSRTAILAAALRAALRGLPGGACTLHRAERIRVLAPVSVPCHVDGDAFGKTPVEIVVGPVQSRVFVP